MFVGKTIYVYGESHKDDKGRIAVNLLCGPDEDDQIALHVNPRFDQKTVVINTRDSQGWGKEERDKKFSLKKPGKPFAIWIVCLKEHFEIFINRNEVFATYKHRIPLKLITHVQVEQNCDIKLICSGIEGQNVPVGVLDGHAVPLDIDVPFFNIRSHSFTIYGKPTNSDSSPRLNEREIVRNTLDKKWETEERDLDFPFLFAKDVPFTVKIIVEKHGFDVDINGIAAFTYNKRIGPLKDIRNISVNGDVELIKMVIS
ncbi:32 kDa beta-galactoside-binding lectin-like isoform X2 [Styela clava]